MDPLSNAPRHLLDVLNLGVKFRVRGHNGSGSAVLEAVKDVSFWLDEAETLGLVGESGCGKSTLARAIVRLYKPTEGRVLFRGEDIAAMEGSRLRAVRRNLQMIFQDPYASLDPRMTVEEIVSEPLHNYGSDGGAVRKSDARARVAELLSLVGLEPGMMTRYPHEFSGGQRQRVGIARALALDPAVVVADEPASALDVSVQAQIINLLQDLQARLRLSYLFISHDLSVISIISRRVAVMYLGEIVESGPTADVFARAWHPYTEALIAAIPVPDPAVERGKRRIVLRGDVPSPMNRPSGCPFHTRCPYVFNRCRSEKPLLVEYAPGRKAACHLLEEPATGSRPSGQKEYIEQRFG